MNQVPCPACGWPADVFDLVEGLALTDCPACHERHPLDAAPAPRPVPTGPRTYLPGDAWA